MIKLIVVLLFPFTLYAQSSGVFNVTEATLYFNDAMEVVSVTKDDTVHITNGTNNLWQVSVAENITISGDTLFVEADGRYTLHLSTTIETVGNVAMRTGIKKTSGGVVGVAHKTTRACAFVWKGDLEKGTVLIPFVVNSQNSINPTFVAGCLTLERTK